MEESALSRFATLLAHLSHDPAEGPFMYSLRAYLSGCYRPLPCLSCWRTSLEVWVPALLPRGCFSQGEPEGGSLPHHALDADLASMLLHQRLADCQS